MRQTIMFIAGDPSGDEHAARVISRLRAYRPDLFCFGIGGPLMESCGFTAVMPFEPFNRMGVGEVLLHLGFFMRARMKLVREMAQRRPGALVLVDYAGFNIPMLKSAHALKIPCLWYIAPKVWAWKKKRAGTLARYARTIAAILPFEPQYFEGQAAKAVYVGNPCVEELERKHRILSAPHPKKLPPKGRSWRLALVPGSRTQEIMRILPSMAGAAALFKKRFDAQIQVSVCRGLDEKLFSGCVGPGGFQGHRGPLDELLAWADLALVTSGTATLQAALMEVPHVLVYKTSLINQILFGIALRIPLVGLPNIVAGREVVRECLQKEANPQVLFRALARFVEEPGHLESTLEGLREVRASLGSRCPSEEVARLVMDMLEGIGVIPA